MIHFFDFVIDLSSPSVWMVLGAILMVAEIITPGVYMLWIGLSALATGLVSWLFPELSWEWLASGFAVLALAMCLVASRFQGSLAPSIMNRRAAALVGQTVVLTTDIKDGSGRAKVGDTTWKVEGEDAPAGTSVVVKAVSGTTLKVEKQ